MTFKNKWAEAFYWWAQTLKPDGAGVLPPKDSIKRAGEQIEKLALEMEAEDVTKKQKPSSDVPGQIEIGKELYTEVKK